MSGAGEFDVIARHFAPLAASARGAFGLTDDAALLETPPESDWVITADAIVAGVHFLPDDPPDAIARKLLRVNLSDLAAKGAEPRHYVLTTAFPRGTDAGWIGAFARGLGHDQRRFGISLLGGDTVSTPGPATFSVTMFGLVPSHRMIRRHGARPGDLICVTGTIGDGGLGLAELRTPHAGLSGAQRRFLIARYRIPQPRTRLARAIRAHASAALDVSDGLIQDLGHIADVSAVRIAVEIDEVPLSPAARIIALGEPAARLAALTAGDDYEIAFAIPPASLDAMRAEAVAARIPIHVIGRVEQGRGVVCLDRTGQPVALAVGGYDHFRSR